MGISLVSRSGVQRGPGCETDPYYADLTITSTGSGVGGVGLLTIVVFIVWGGYLRGVAGLK